MPPRKRALSKVDAIPSESVIIKPSTEVGTHTLPSTRKSKLPSAIRFPLAVLLSLTISTLLLTLVSDYVLDLTAIKRLDADWDTAVIILGTRVAEISLAWISGFDGYDVAALAFLTHTPYYYLLLTFYTVTAQTVGISMTIDMLSISVPFYLLRGAAAPHQVHAPRGSIANRSVVEDLPIQIVTSVLGAGVYGAVILSAYFTFLRTWLILYFENLPSLAAAYDTQFFILVLGFLPVGVATKVFLFTPAAAAKRDAIDAINAQFHAETATLSETVLYNVWGFSKRSRVLISRTFLLAAVSAASATSRTFESIEGVELLGAAGWASTWALASVLTGVAYGWVTGTDVLGS